MIPLSDDPPRRSAPVVMIAIVLANIAMFLYELTLGDRALDQFFFSAGVIPSEYVTGRNIGPPPPGGLIYLTLLTSMFMHGGFLHIASNMLYLWVFGDNVEDRFGHLGFLIFYLAAGVVASLTHIFMNMGSQIPSVGASGAIAGVLGAYLVMFPGASIRTLVFLGPFILLPRISAIFLIGFWFLSQAFAGLASLGATSEQTSGVAVWAHIGGFIAGIVLVPLFRRR
ncbi:MAG TPA: rhomboid family intramembrane serine protease [Chloroflexota bacterium]|nr:rhomboid family intramembrane serine protease [Chloroflexota bacterium]